MGERHGADRPLYCQPKAYRNCGQNPQKPPLHVDNRTKVANLTFSVRVAQKTAVELLVAAKVNSPHATLGFGVAATSYCVPRMRCRQIGAGKSRLQKMIVAPSSPARPRPQRIAFKAIGPNAAKLPVAS